MALNTSKGITYPTSGDSIAPLETVFATMATTTNTALSNINAGTDITAGSLPLTRGGTGGTSALTALVNLGAVASADSDFAGKNVIINGAFDLWQRTTTAITSNATGYWADRWRYTATGGTSKVLAQSRQAFTAGAAPLPGQEGRFFYRVAVTTAGTGYTYEAVEQPIEDVRTFANSQVTVSFYAKTTAGTVSVTPQLIQNFGTGGTAPAPSASVTTAGTAKTVTTTWQRFTQTLTVPSINTKTIGTNEDSSLILSLLIPSNSLYTVDIWGVQVEAGPNATVFFRCGANITGELTLAQRYYYRTTNTLSANVPFGAGMQFSASIAWVHIKFPKKMRIAPTALEASAAATFQMVCTAGTSATAVAFGSVNDDGGYISLTVAGTGGQGGIGRFTGTAGTAFIGFSAEL